MAPDRGTTYRSVWTFLMQVPFRQGYIDVNGLNTRYMHAGSDAKPTVLMLHGTGGHWEAFCANIGPLSKHFNCYAIDMMGCGFTDKPDKPYEIKDYADHAIGFMNAIKIDRAAVIGISLGSWVTTKIALDHPDRISKMILISPPGLLPMSAGPNAGVAARRASANDPSWENITSVMEKLFFDKSSLMDDLVAVRQRVYSLPGIEKIMPRMLTLFDPDIRARNTFSEAQWRSIRTPTLVIIHVDTNDIYLETATKIAKLLPHVQTLTMKKTAHWSNFEDASAFNTAAIDFLKSP